MRRSGREKFFLPIVSGIKVVEGKREMGTFPLGGEGEGVWHMG